ncbi:MAG: SRPBCC family protein [Chloroflexi bacterium]|nr:SRPBCC family protein [Chloroflexota bacterium]MDA8189806.1 SRPBCC family protein [Dehalococcoidales bacterium]
MARAEKSIDVNVNVDKVFDLWSNFAIFPRFMENIREIREVRPGTFHWRAEAPLGRTFQWDTEIVEKIPNARITWRSISDGINQAGSVTLEPLPQGTRVTVVMDYETPAGTLGEAIAQLFIDPNLRLESDLRRFKEIVEGRMPL